VYCTACYVSDEPNSIYVPIKVYNQHKINVCFIFSKDKLQRRRTCKILFHGSFLIGIVLNEIVAKPFSVRVMEKTLLLLCHSFYIFYVISPRRHAK